MGLRIGICGTGAWEDRHPDGLFRRDQNIWKNSFSNETALFRMSDGSMFRVNEFRRVGHPGTNGVSIYGTEASYEEQTGFPGDTRKAQVWLTKNGDDRERLSDLLDPAGVPFVPEDDAMKSVTGDDGTHLGVSKIHDVGRLPAEYKGMPNGHQGSHQFLVDDFIRSCHEKTMPPNNVWHAARYLVPGLVAHQSALADGEKLEVPDFGDPPGDGNQPPYFSR
ncbi:MAG: hypothetical protein ACLFST_00065 [Spirochaetia bacterium]